MISLDDLCACPVHDDPVACMDLRYHHRSPGPIHKSNRETGVREECECACHAEWAEDHEDDDEEGGS